MKTKIFAVAALALMAAACQKNGGENPQPEPGPAPEINTIDLATVTANTTVPDGYTLTGTLGGNYKISIADGASVALKDVTINGVNDEQYDWAGLTCEGDATLVLFGTNEIHAFNSQNPGIYVPGDKEDAGKNKTLTIEGKGSLTAAGNEGAGIGSGCSNKACGNIFIKSGTIYAEGNGGAPGIGAATQSTCGDITISGGVIWAKGNQTAAGIGSSYQGTCGNITVEGTTIWVKATKGDQGEYTIGAGKEGACGTVTFDGTVGDTKESPYYYPLHTIKLDYVTENTVAKYNYVLTGTLKGNYKISIADQAEVTLDNVTINGTNDEKYPWAGITCEGTASIYLKGENWVKGFCKGFPGIYVPANKTLSITSRDVLGTLHTSNNGDAAGIGAGKDMACGNINISGGAIYADGGKTGWGGAGIGGSYGADCGEIFIINMLDCFVYANGGKGSAGIGGGQNAKCDKITITDVGAFWKTEMKLQVTKMADSPCTIGKGAGDSSTCGTVSINQTEGAITDSPYIYPIELLATINSNGLTDFLSGKRQFGNAWLEITGDARNDGSEDGWRGQPGELVAPIFLTLSAAEGYTMTHIEFDLKTPSAVCKMTEKTKNGTFVICATSSETYNCIINDDGSYRQGTTLYGQYGPNCIRVYGYKNE